jgi:hypothetical protein
MTTPRATTTIRDDSTLSARDCHRLMDATVASLLVAAPTSAVAAVAPDAFYKVAISDGFIEINSFWQ